MESPCLNNINIEDHLMFNEFFGPSRTTDPDRELSVALLEGALNDIHNAKTSLNARKERYWAVTWVLLEGHEANDFIPFDTCCENLGLNPSAIRRALLNGVDIPEVLKQFFTIQVPKQRNHNYVDYHHCEKCRVREDAKLAIENRPKVRRSEITNLINHGHCPCGCGDVVIGHGGTIKVCIPTYNLAMELAKIEEKPTRAMLWKAIEHRRVERREQL